MVRHWGRRDNTECQHTLRVSLVWGENVGSYQGWGWETWGHPVWGHRMFLCVAMWGRTHATSPCTCGES